MKKLIVSTFAVLAIATCANAFSLPKIDASAEKVQLNKCLLEEGQKQLVAGKLTSNTLDAVSKDVASTCTTKLALKGSNAETIRLATEVLQKLVK